MRLHLWAAAVALLAELGSAGAATAQTPPSPPLATRQDVFTIPFSVPASRDPAQAPVEVRLYVSADHGAHWHLYSRQRPQTGKFQFQAPRDGEYWFASRTVDAAGRMLPAQEYQPELRVMVDTAGPQLELQVQLGPAGEVQAAWNIADPNLVMSSFRILYRHKQSEQWQPVAVDLPTGPNKQQYGGTTTWWPQQDGGKMEVRAEVQDRAGNKNVVQRMIDLPRVADGGAARPVAQSERSIPWPADEVLRAGPNRPPPREQAPSPPPPRRPDERPSPAPINPEVAHLVDQNEPTEPPPSLELPGGERPRMTRLTRFNLEYDVQGVGPSGVSRVELWGTRDGGRLWQRWSEDDDRRSPILVEVDGEGVYGFRIVVESGNGLRGHMPRSGDPAEVWIGVDQTPPQAAITSARYGRGEEAGRLSIFWRADDAALHPRPVTLLFSAGPNGPWTTIAAGLPNDGRYDWRVDHRVPESIYLRLEVRDEAGNLAVHQLDRPIANDGLVPRGRIRGIQPPAQ